MPINNDFWDHAFVVFGGKFFQQIVRARGVKSRMCPPYPQRDRKRRLNGAVCRNHRIKRGGPVSV